MFDFFSWDDCVLDLDSLFFGCSTFGVFARAVGFVCHAVCLD